MQRLDRRVDQHFELRQLRMQAKLRGDGKLIRELELVGGVELGFDLDRLDRRAAQAQRIHPHAVLSSRHRLNLQRAGQRVRVVLQRDDALHHGRVRIHGDDAALDQAGRDGIACHRKRLIANSFPVACQLL